MAEERPIDRDLARGTDRDIEVASPPDDGGHMGAFTVPEDTMEVAGPDDRLGPTPPTMWDTSRTGTIDRAAPNRGLSVTAGTLVIVVVVAAAVGLTLLLAGA